MWIHLLLGALQGIAEWLPISSQAVLVLAQVHLLGETNIGALIETALFFHLGTFFAALVYYRKDIRQLIGSLLTWKTTPLKIKKEIRFYVIATAISAALGFGLLMLLERVVFDFELAGKIITLGVGVLLLGTAVLQVFASKQSERALQEPTPKDAVIAGIGQGFAALPGVSRSGTTVSLLLLRGLNKRAALSLSFIMSLPIVLGGNILLNLNETSLSAESLVGLLSAFVFGLLTIHGLVKLAERVKFSWFVGFFGVLTLISGIWFM
jgi:undecaprenyl-diphosphatase